MKFKIISIKGDSVRVKTGIATFDVLVINDSGKMHVKIPSTVYIADTRDFNNLVGAALAEFNHSNTEDNHSNARKLQKESS